MDPEDVAAGGSGDGVDLRRAAASLYEQLRAIARARMAGERASHTLAPTALANEALLRVMRTVSPASVNDEKHLLALAAEAMRRVLVEHARARSRIKRGGAKPPTSLSALEDDDAVPAVRLQADPAEVLSLSEALAKLEADDAEAATIVKLRSFAGMDPDEVAALVGVSRRTVERRWRFAMARLRAELTDETGRDEG